MRDLLARVMPRWLRVNPPHPPVAGIGEDAGRWIDDGSGERECWSGHHMDELSPHSAWAHGDTILQPAVEAPVSQPEPAVQLPAVDGVVYDLDWLKLPRPGRHRAPEGVR